MDQFDSPKSDSLLVPIIISVAATTVIVGAGIFWWANQKQNELKNEIINLHDQINHLELLERAPISNPTKTTQPSRQSPEATPIEDSNGLIEINQTTIYKNTALGFQMTFPAGWYLPAATDNDPHAYSCATYHCQNGALEVVHGGDFVDKNFDEFFSESKKQDPDAKELINFIAGARVIKAKPQGEWLYHYDIIFYNQKKRFLIATDSDKLESVILPSFKLLQ